MPKNRIAVRTLKEIREENSLSVRGMALKVGVSPNTITRIENGLPVRHTTKLKIAKALKLSPEDIEFFVVA